MHSEHHTADGDDQGDGTEEDGRLMVGELLTVVVSEPVHDKDTVVHADTEDEGGDDDVDEVETHVEEHHRSQHDDPTEQDRHKAQQSVLEVEVETDEQHDEHEQHRYPLQHVEVLTHLYLV